MPAATEDTIVEQDPDDMSFGVGFTQLTTIKRAVRDQWPEITDVKRWVSESVQAADTRQNGKMTSFAQERLPAEVAPVFAVYMQRSAGS